MKTTIEEKESLLAKRSTIFVVSLLLLGLYYLSYRYPLKINNSVTSPTYSDTPFILQIAKYALFGAILYLTAFVSMANKVRTSLQPSLRLEITGYLFITVMSFAAMFAGRSDYMAQTGIFFIALMVACLFNVRELNNKWLSRAFHWFLFCSIVMDGYQIMNYYLFGRLPALGYEGSVNVRFGSLWDDPNGFALILAFLLPLYWKANHRLVSKIVVSVLVFVMLFYTLSLTGTASVIGSIIIGSIILHLHQKNLDKATMVLMLALVVAAIAFGIYKFGLEDNTWVNQFMHAKQSSIDAHASYAGDATLQDLLKIVSVTPVGKFSESGYINMLVNFGLVFFIVYMIVGLVTVIRLLRLIRDYKNEPYSEVYYGSLFFVIAFFLGMMNIPYDVVFPINLIYVLCILISFTKPTMRRS